MPIDVIIPSRRRPIFLKQCLAGLVRQTKRPARVIIIENDRQSVYRKLVKEFKNLNLKLYLEPKLGKASARNTGLRLATAPIIAFLDDDCQPPADWLSNIVKTYRRFPDADALIGDSTEKNKSLLMRAYTFQYQKFFFKIRVNFKTGRVYCGGALNSRNFCLKKSFVDRYCLRFDCRYDRFGFAEDTDFGEQLELAGARIYYTSQIQVIHTEETQLFALLVKKFQNGRAMEILKTKGIFHNYRWKKTTILKRIIKLGKKIKARGLFPSLVFNFYISSIIFSYRGGMLFQMFITNLRRFVKLLPKVRVFR